MDVDVSVRMQGPFFRRRVPEVSMRKFEHEAVDNVSAQLKAEWMANLNRSIRNPTPYYETQVTRSFVVPNIARVHDRDVVYGPWLEGTSERNRTTRFRGYASLRRARQATEARIPQLVAAARARLVAALNGGP